MQETSVLTSMGFSGCLLQETGPGRKPGTQAQGRPAALRGTRSGVPDGERRAGQGSCPPHTHAAFRPGGFFFLLPSLLFPFFLPSFSLPCFLPSSLPSATQVPSPVCLEVIVPALLQAPLFSGWQGPGPGAGRPLIPPKWGLFALRGQISLAGGGCRLERARGNGAPGRGSSFPQEIARMPYVMSELTLGLPEMTA